jgi:predicted secreted protein with PEFG-CTERM motif
LNNFLLLIPLLAILGGVGLSFDSAFAADYVLDESFCENQMNGSWNNAVSPRLGGTCIAEEYGLESGNTLEIPFHVELKMQSIQPTLGISSGATLNIAGELTIRQDYEDRNTFTGTWQGSSAIANFGTINALDYSDVNIRPDRDSIFNSGAINIRGDSEALEDGIPRDSTAGTVTNYYDDLSNDRVEFFGQETLDQSTCEDVMRAEWNSNTCIMYHWVVFKSGSELTIPSGVTLKLAPSDGGYNVSVDDGATIINDGTIIIDTVTTYPFYNQGTFINNGDYLIDVSTFAGLYSNGTVENYGIISSSEQNRFYALWVADGSFTNYGTIDVPDYLISNAYRITESDIPDAALDLDSDGYSDDVDCNDFDNNTYPGATELADGLDNNCDGVIPNSELDLDNDGYIESNFDSYIWQGSMSVMGGNDCDDGDATTYPGASETDPNIDSNCDGSFIEVDSVDTSSLVDADGDGYASIESGGNDCDDGDATTYPGASETDPNIDSNCDGSFIEVDSVDTSSLVDAGVDIIPPVINVPENTQLEVETAGSLVTQFFRATAVDETDGNVAVDCTFPQNNKYRVGTTTVTCTAIDDAGNDSQKSFSVTVVVTDGDAITCGEGTELFAGECRAIPQRQDPTVDVPELTSPEVEQTQTTIGLIATVTDTFENGVTTLDIKFNKNYVNYEIDITQNGDRLLKETSHALGTTATYKVTAAGSVENPIDVKITSLGIGLPGQEDRWTGPTGLITTVQVVPEFGTIAMMILVVAIVSVVAITSKSRLMTKF